MKSVYLRRLARTVCRNKGVCRSCYATWSCSWPSLARLWAYQAGVTPRAEILSPQGLRARAWVLQPIDTVHGYRDGWVCVAGSIPISRWPVPDVQVVEDMFSPEFYNGLIDSVFGSSISVDDLTLTILESSVVWTSICPHGAFRKAEVQSLSARPILDRQHRHLEFDAGR